LLCFQRENLLHRQFSDLPRVLKPNDLLVCNNSKVIPARLRGIKITGGQVEMLIERVLDEHRILAQVRASKSPKIGSQLIFAHQIHFEVLNRHEGLFELRCLESIPVLKIIEDIGEIPLPPYFERVPERLDHERYQTIYASSKGSVAAPTAGLHFDETLVKQLIDQGVEMAYLTLHVGSGTFVPVRTEAIEQHQMHAESVEVSAALCDKINATRAKGGKIIAVGTTSARALETASLSGELRPYVGDTDIFIYPGFQFRCIDALITNFHLPRSTLLMLVAAFGGYQKTMAAYQEAIKEKYRFFSYGDAMFVIS
jgi:S-adenosylmethionine:tRNA ribosyltransferase-isomerase